MGDLAERLFRLQRALGIKTKGELAIRLGVSRTTLYNYEQGVHPAGDDVLAMLDELEKENDIAPPSEKKWSDNPTISNQTEDGPSVSEAEADSLLRKTPQTLVLDFEPDEFDELCLIASAEGVGPRSWLMGWVRAILKERRKEAGGAEAGAVGRLSGIPLAESVQRLRREVEENENPKKEKQG